MTEIGTLKAISDSVEEDKGQTAVCCTGPNRKKNQIIISSISQMLTIYQGL